MTENPIYFILTGCRVDQFTVGMEGENYFTRIDGLIDNSEGSMNLSQGRTLGRVVCLIELNRPV